MLEQYLKERQRQRGMLLMTHIVAGHPDFDTSLRLVESMALAGVDLIELQIPFSEPIADGPVILRANQQALEGGTTVEKCFELARDVTARHPIPFLFMTYYNILFRQGVDRFVERAAAANMVGAIVPDCPPEEADEYLASMRRRRLAPIFIFSPRTTDDRLRMLGKAGDGFVYVVARKGVTGAETSFSAELESYLARCRAATELPLAVGFGVKDRRDVDFLRGKADIAVVGTQSLRVMDEQGIEGVKEFIRSLRA